MTSPYDASVNQDRTVHASAPGMELVRYDRSGKWYLEPTIAGLPRQHVTISAAVDWAMWAWQNGGSPHIGRRGGSRFDALIRKRVES